MNKMKKLKTGIDDKKISRKQTKKFTDGKVSMSGIFKHKSDTNSK